MTDKDKTSLRIAVALPVNGTFTYAVPDNLVSKAYVGCRVMAPFRNQKVTGYILEIIEGEHEKGLREIMGILDPEPLFHEGLVPFFQWVADYYIHPIGRLIQSALPCGLNVIPYKTGRLTEKGLRVSGLLPPNSDERKLLTWIKENPGKRLSSRLDLANEFQQKGWLIIESKAGKRRIGPLIRKFVRIKDGVDINFVLEKEEESLRAKNEFEFLETLFNSDGIQLKKLTSRFTNGSYLVNKWIKKGVLEGYSAPVFRNLAGKIMFPSPPPSQLYDQQKRVLGVIRKHLGNKAFFTCLLHGVTGSGKTEVYYKAIELAIQMGRQAILMVPEIALAIYMEGIFRSRLGNKIAIFHSGLGEGERYEQWMRMVRGDVALVIGARSALFAPFLNLGLIIVDEEHDPSYKQENSPRYQARDAAVVRGKMEKAVVILGSGTPSIQSFHNTVTGRYQLLSMPDRVEKRPLPDMETVDMKTISGGEKRNGIISPPLKKALDKNLADDKQAILFLNRRGFDRVYLCRSCGESIRCHNCDLALIYHHKENLLVCHYCGFHSKPQGKCPSCGHRGIKAYGFGTEKLEQELRDVYPEICIARMDRDSTRRKGRVFQILKKFSEQEIDILVGTQMITKGYDFPNVTLVGVIAADFSLGFPDFRAGERTFQILSQVAGRAGRGDQKGRVIVQTFNPKHYAITTAEDHDYQSFFHKEMELREQLGYPPFSYLAYLRLQGNNKKVTAAMAKQMGRGITGLLDKWPRRGKYRWQILVKSKKAVLLHYFLDKVGGLSRKLLKASGVTLTIDVDPYQML